MKILKILSGKFAKEINNKSGDWDDAMNIPDIAEMVTDDKNEKENPLCSDFWKYQVFNKPNIEFFAIDKNSVINSYKQ